MLSARFQRFLFLVLISNCQLSAQDMMRYPIDSLAYAADNLSHYQGSYQDYLMTSLQVGIDSSFSLEQRDIIDRSLQIFLERSLTSRVLDCAYRNSYKDMPASRGSFEEDLYKAISPLSLGNGIILPSFAFISRYHNDPRSVGVGYVNLFYDTDRPLGDFGIRHYLYIALNSDHLGPDSSYNFASNPDYWAGVVAHEFLHNLGYTHPSGYPGSFIREYGKCIEFNGMDFDCVEGLEDIEVYREFDQ